MTEFKIIFYDLQLNIKGSSFNIRIYYAISFKNKNHVSWISFSFITPIKWWGLSAQIFIVVYVSNIELKFLFCDIKKIIKVRHDEMKDIIFHTLLTGSSQDY